MGRKAETVWLGARATEANLKALSRSGELARYRVLHFATHGLLAGESEDILRAKAEPALMLTPPKDGATPKELEEDDGLLTASEVAQLELDADWVVLSACNTAAGDRGDAEALSGLARAFFYAKARTLLVSHWYVESEFGGEAHYRRVCRAQRRPSDWPRRGAAQVDGAAHRRRRQRGAPGVLGAVCAGGRRREVGDWRGSRTSQIGTRRKWVNPSACTSVGGGAADHPRPGSKCSNPADKAR